ncbi:MAG: NACHT domain-containing protein [Bryobacteraceae bacterium]
MAAFNHGFAHDVFISYAHVDYDWVTAFHKVLMAELKTRAPKIDVWRDEQLRTGAWVDKTILPAVRGSAVFLPVISQAWVESEYCQQELAEYCGRTYVCAERVPVDKLPQPLPEVLREQFYKKDGGRAITLGSRDASFKKAVQRLAEDIVRQLKELKPGAQQLDGLVAEVRERMRPRIQDRCGTMKILDMTQPIDLGGIYADVHLLDQVQGRRRTAKEELESMEGRAVKAERLPGLDVLKKHKRLMILGGPGSGKTTFLKRIAFQCAEGELAADVVPVFLALSDWAAAPGSPSLREMATRGWGARADEILNAGRALILLDGLDEVRDADHDRVRRGIEEFSSDWERCTVVVTCRIAAREHVYERFTEVQMAEFDERQIRQFAEGWFRTKGVFAKAAEFVKHLNSNKPLRDLASRPLLLTLLCLIYEERTDFEGDRAELYKEAFDVMLRRWDANRSIVRDGPYKSLSVERRRDLLAEVAWNTFLSGDVFFTQEGAEAPIRTFFSVRDRLLNEGEELDPATLLRVVEAQHGLLVERAVRVYSFAHLTFQEYLVAARASGSQQYWDELAPRIGDPRFREVFLLAVSLLDPARLDPAVALPRLKKEVDLVVANNASVQRFLAAASEIELPAEWGCHRPAARRAIRVTLCVSQTLEQIRATAFDREAAKDLASALNRDLVIERALEFGLRRASELALNPRIADASRLLWYLHANLTLVQGMRQARAASRATVAEIQESLLLPAARSAKASG